MRVGWVVGQQLMSWSGKRWQGGLLWHGRWLERGGAVSAHGACSKRAGGHADGK